MKKDNFQFQVPQNKLKVSAAGIRDIEKALQVALPNDFVEFVKEFGPGELCGWLRIHAPSDSSNMLDLIKLNEFLQSHACDYDASQTIIKKLKMAVPFADCADGTLFFWLKDDLKRGESPVYYAVRRPKSLPKLADSFTNLIAIFISNSTKAPFKGLKLSMPPEFSPIREHGEDESQVQASLTTRIAALSKLKRTSRSVRENNGGEK